MERTRTVHLTGAILLAGLIGLLPSITAWAGTFEAPAFVEANPDGSYSYEAIYTPGANEALNFESAEPIHNTTGLHSFGDGFCEIPLEEGVPFLVMGEPIYGWLVDPTSLGIHRVSIGTCPNGTPTATPSATSKPGATPTATPSGTPLPLGASISEPEDLVERLGDTIIIEGNGGTIETTFVPFGSVACMENRECALEHFC